MIVFPPFHRGRRLGTPYLQPDIQLQVIDQRGARTQRLRNVAQTTQTQVGLLLHTLIFIHILQFIHQCIKVIKIIHYTSALQRHPLKTYCSQESESRVAILDTPYYQILSTSAADQCEVTLFPPQLTNLLPRVSRGEVGRSPPWLTNLGSRPYWGEICLFLLGYQPLVECQVNVGLFPFKPIELTPNFFCPSLSNTQIR